MPALLGRSSAALVRRRQWVRLPPLAILVTGHSSLATDRCQDAGAGRRGGRLQTDLKQVRLLPASLDKDVLLGEQSSSNLDAEGSNPSVLAFTAL